MTMHEGQVDLHPDEVAGLVAARLPELAGPVIRPVESSGTVNALFRIGDDLVARFPLVPAADDARRREIDAEMAHARVVATRVSLAVPVPVCLGAPADRYPGWWSVWRWLPGTPADPDALADPAGFARDLAAFVREYREMPTGGRERAASWRGGGPLRDKDEWVRYSIARSTHLVDTGAVTAIWDECLRAEPYRGEPVFVHADLLPANLLVRYGKLAAVIDLGGPHVGDPAADLTPAWHIFDRDARRVWRAALGPDDATWARSRGWALEQAIGALHYYEHTNRPMAAAARRTLHALIDG
jgi:aminoglycoside phosphotransferase (APT) family kinase protein